MLEEKYLNKMKLYYIKKSHLKVNKFSIKMVLQHVFFVKMERKTNFRVKIQAIKRTWSADVFSGYHKESWVFVAVVKILERPSCFHISCAIDLPFLRLILVPHFYKKLLLSVFPECGGKKTFWRGTSFADQYLTFFRGIIKNHKCLLPSSKFPSCLLAFIFSSQ